MNRLSYFRAGIVALILCGVWAQQSAASVILSLSTHSSEDPFIPASELGATLEFSVTGSELTLAVTNQTTQFNIRQVYFNADDTVSGLTLTSSTKSGWNLRSNINQQPGFNTSADGFGIYSFKLQRTSGSDANPELIMPGQTSTFTMDISGSGFSVISFVNTLSGSPDGSGHIPGFAAAHFVQGDNDDSAWGTTVTSPAVPAPAAGVVLLGLFIGRRRRS